MKCGISHHLPSVNMSRPVRALWIEIMNFCTPHSVPVSRPVRALWIEMTAKSAMGPWFPSRPVRALWIEMSAILSRSMSIKVEAREGLVD